MDRNDWLTHEQNLCDDEEYRHAYELAKENERERWDEVMALCRQYGLIMQAAGDVAIIATPTEQIKHKIER